MRRNDNQQMDSNWRLDEINIEFKKGYYYKENSEEKEDRYEGMIRFKNGDNESFKFKIKPDIAQNFIDLISDEIVESATELGEKLKESLNLE